MVDAEPARESGPESSSHVRTTALATHQTALSDRRRAHPSPPRQRSGALLPAVRAALGCAAGGDHRPGLRAAERAGALCPIPTLTHDGSPIDRLVLEGRVIRRRGSGTYARSQPSAQRLCLELHALRKTLANLESHTTALTLRFTCVFRLMVIGVSRAT